jgi:CubicO group peptidase (beta-lactamase class C family)
MNTRDIHGFFHDDFSGVAHLLQKQVAREGRGGAAVCIYHHGEKVVDIWTGERSHDHTPWESDTMAVSFSTTKGVLSTAVHILVDRGLCNYHDPVSRYWPEFGCKGKETITIGQVLSHQTGLYAVSPLINHIEQFLDWDYMCAQLASCTPRIKPGTRPGYQALTYGWLAGELIRRISGKPVEQFVQDAIAGPLNLDGLYLLTPPSEKKRVADLIASRSPEPGTQKIVTAETRHEKRLRRWLPNAMVHALVPPGIKNLIFASHLLDAPIPAFNGVFTARSLAKMYGALACGGEIEGRRLLSEKTLQRATKIQTRRRDKVLLIPMCWSLGYHIVPTSRGVPRRAFGHFGYGGSGAWADPQRGLAVAMTLNRIAGSPVGDRRMVSLGGAALKAAKRHQRSLRKPTHASPEVLSSKSYSRK